DGDAGDESRHGFRDEHFPDDGPCVGPHGFRRFDDTIVDFLEPDFHQSGIEQGRADDQCRNRAVRSHDGSHHHFRERNQDDDQYDERNRPEQVYQECRDTVYRFTRPDFTFWSQEQDDAEHDAEYECECCCDGGHIDRFISRLPDCVPLYIFKGEHFREFIDQLIHRSSTSTVTSWSASSAFSLPSVPSSTSIATNRWPYDSLFVRLMLPDSIFRSRSYFLTTCDTIGAFDCEPTNPNLRIFDVGNSSLTSSKDRAVSSSLISS